MNKRQNKIWLFLTSQAISLFGSSLVQYSIIWYITLETKSGLMMTIATICGVLPQVIISLFAGVWADRYNKKTLIILSDSAIAITTLIIAIFFMYKIDYIWLLFIVLGIRSLGSGVQAPTTTSLIPELVSDDKLMKVNGINTTMQSLIMILSPAASGALLANVNLEYIFLIDVITAIIGVTILMIIKYDYKKKEKNHDNYLTSIKEGLVYTKNHKLIYRLLIYLLIFNMLLTPAAALTPLLVTRTFGAEAWYLTANEIVYFVGSIIGGIIISMWGGFSNKIKTMGLGCLICGIFGVLIGLPFNFIYYLVCIGIMGVTMPFINTPFTTILQEQVDSDKIGRVFSLVSMIAGASIPVSMIVYGPLSDIIKIEYILIGTGILFIIGVIVLFKDKIIMKQMNSVHQ